jgi:hypothetical protein
MGYQQTHMVLGQAFVDCSNDFSGGVNGNWYCVVKPVLGAKGKELAKVIVRESLFAHARTTRRRGTVCYVIAYDLVVCGVGRG